MSVDEKSAAGWLSAFGLSQPANDPMAQVYPLLLARFRPSQNSVGGTWDAYCTACMIAGGLLYFKKTPGDCGGAAAKASGGGSLKGIATGASIAASALGTAGAIASMGALSIAGAATGGVAMILGAVAAIFQHHSAAVAQEQDVNCAVMQAFNPTAYQIDQAVMSGTISGSQGQAAYASLVQQATNGLQSVSKPDNWGFGTEAVLQAMAAFKGYQYGAVALPMGVPASAVIAAKSVSTQIVRAATVATQITAAQTTPTLSQAPQVAALSVSSTMPTVLIILVIFLVVWGIAR